MRTRAYVVRGVLMCGLLIALPLQAAVFSADAVKAAFLYRFASYIEWPEDAPTGPLVIAVSGADEVARQLSELLPQVNVNGRPVAVRRVSKPAELDGVHILYVGPDSLARTRALRTAALNRPILIVTDDEKGLDSGGVINFVEAERNVRFEISLLAADRARLKINSALLSVAARVERRPQAWTHCADPYLRRYRPAACVIRTASVNGGVLR
jgi:YfiR/HmsC-like